MKRLTAVAAMLVAASAAFAQPTATPSKPAAPTAQPAAKPAATLSIGDKAPAISVEKWVKGEPITGFEKGKVYVVEFWATWCGPCKVTMPHLTELQKEYKDKGVTIIGTNIWEDKNFNAETLAKVEKFVKESTTMGYTVAYDGSAKAMDTNYMKASGAQGIPTAFIVNQDGKIAFIGHPAEMDDTLKQVVAGNFDLEKAKAEYKKAKEAPKPAANPAASMQKFEAEFKKMLKDGKYDDAYKVASEKLDGEYKGNAQGCNLIAWTIVDPVNNVGKKDLDLALKAANRAMELTKNNDGAITDTLAWVHFHKGDVAKAIELEKKAIELVKNNPEMKSELEATLKQFEAGKK